MNFKKKIMIIDTLINIYILYRYVNVLKDMYKYYIYNMEPTENAQN